jgi:hypothetical protein
MFEDLWSLFCFDLPAFASVIVVGALAFIGWLSVLGQRPFRVRGSLIALTACVLCDGAAVLNSFLGEKLFPMTAYAGGLVPFFYKWQVVSFALILTAGAFLIRERATSNRAVRWGAIGQLVMHCSEVILFILWRLT